MYIAKDDYEKTAEKFFQTLLNPHEFPTGNSSYYVMLSNISI